MFGGRFWGRRFFGARYWGDGGGGAPPEPPVTTREVWWPVTLRKKRQGPDVGLARELIRQAEEAGQKRQATLKSFEELAQALPPQPVIEEPKPDPGAIVAEIKEQALIAAELAELKRREEEAALVLLLLD